MPRTRVFQDLLVDGLGADRRHVSFEQRVPEAQGRIDAILGRTAFEVKTDLVRELGDAEEQLSRYLPEREKATRSRFLHAGLAGREDGTASYREAFIAARTRSGLWIGHFPLPRRAPPPCRGRQCEDRYQDTRRDGVCVGGRYGHPSGRCHHCARHVSARSWRVADDAARRYFDPGLCR
jgi:hypothetical protein